MKKYLNLLFNNVTGSEDIGVKTTDVKGEIILSIENVGSVINITDLREALNEAERFYGADEQKPPDSIW